MRLGKSMWIVLLLSSSQSLFAANQVRSADLSKERVIFHTTVGDIAIVLYPKAAPQTVAQFLTLARAGVFDTTYFFRIKPGFFAQTSNVFDRATPINETQKKLIHTLPLESSSLTHQRGVLSLTRDVTSDPNSGGTSFCVMLGTAPWLDGHYTIFGAVEKGDAVLSALEQSSTSNDSKPTVRIELTRVEVIDSETALTQRVLEPAKTLLPPTPNDGQQAPSCHPGAQMTTDTFTPITSTASAASPARDKPLQSFPPISKDSPATVEDHIDPNGDKIRTVLFKNLVIDKIYPSMHGPWTRQTFKLAPDTPYIWIKGYRAEVLDQKTGEASQEFMCHTNLNIVTASSANQPQSVHSQLSISQGQKELDFPKGFALRLDNAPDAQIDLSAMVLNSNYPDIHKALDFKATVRYVDEKTAQNEGLMPLTQTAVFTLCPVEPSGGPGDKTPVCESATDFEIYKGLPYNRKQTSHWVVPAGAEQTFTNDVTTQLHLEKDTMVHYIWMHLHPYGEWIELKDATTGLSVWKGTAKNDKKLIILLATDSYSSTKGIKLFKDHRYELTTHYHNKTDHATTAMAALWMYIE